MKLVRIAGSSLFLPEFNAAQPLGARVGFVLWDDDGRSEIGLQASWGRGGYAVWPDLTQRTGLNWSTFGNKIRTAFLAQNSGGTPNRETRFGMFTDRGVSTVDDWIVVALGDGSGNPDITFNSVELAVGNESFRVNIQDGAPISVGPDKIVFKSAPAAHTMRVIPEDGGAPAGVPWDIDGPVVLSFRDAATAGCFEFRSTLEQDSLSNLGVLLRFSAAGEYDPTFGDAPIHSSRFTLFTYDGPFADSHMVDVSIDLQHPYNKGRSAVAFAGAKEHGASPKSLAFLTYFETADGHRVGLIPLAESRLVFARHVIEYRNGGLPNSRARNYLTPDGQFEFVVPKDNGSGKWPARHRLLTGLSRTEYLEFAPRRPNIPGNVIKFTSGQPAVDFRTIPSGFGSDEDATGDVLSSELTTSWLEVPDNVGPSRQVSRQPERLTLHGKRKEAGFGSDNDDPGLLDFDPNRVEHKAPLPAVPLLGLSRTGDSTNTAVDFEKRILSPHRSKLLKQTSGGQGSDESAKTVYTPQGFRIRKKDDGSWNEVLIAHIPLGGSNFSEILLTKVNDDFVDLMMRNRVFMVADSVKDVANPSADLFGLEGQFNVAGWGFSAKLQGQENDDGTIVTAPENPDEMPTALIVKSYDKSIADLVKDPQLWTNRSQLGSDKLLHLQKVLDAYIKEARTLHEQDKKANPGVKSRYKPFLDAVDKADWNGFLLVNLDIKKSDLPLQIKGLLGGVDDKKLSAHHFGVTLTKNERVEGSLTPQKSSLFGLVDYPKPGSGPAPKPKDPHGDRKKNDSRYDFKIEKLSVLFENAEITRFDCRINLYVGAFFTESVKSESGNGDDTGRILTFDGKYEGRVIDGVRRDTYTFIHKEDYEFVLDTLIFEKLSLTKLQFTTVSAKPIGPGKEEVKTRVALWGAIDFHVLSADVGFPGIEKLDFDDLGITFKFKLGEKEVPDLIPNFDVGPVRFELPEGGMGKGFLPSLPFKLKFFQTAPQNKPLDLGKEGYFGMSLDGALPRFRFGLGFDLDLGSLGALASKLDGIRLTLLFGWLPKVDNDDKKGFAIGLRFEGGGGQNLDIGLQGILRLTAEDYEFGKVSGGNDKDYFMVALKKAHLYILGYKIPKDDGLALFLFVDPENPDVDKIGWFMGMTNLGSPDGFDVRYLGLGQRVNAYTDAGVPSTREVIDKLISHGEARTKEQVKEKIAEKQILYDADRDWTVGLRTLIYDAFDLDIVFMDPDMYGARLRVPSTSSPAPLLFDIDILYRKITDDLGVYSTEIVLPDHIRQMEFGAASVTIPVIGLDFWTDGGVTVDLGYPGEQLDFSRSFTVQILPFLGSGGMIYSRINGLGATTFPQPVDTDWIYDPVMRVAFAARVGLGKEIRKGILRAGLSLSVFGMIDGTWGQLRYVGSETTPQRKAPTSYVIVAGRYGVIGEIFGYVDFRIVRAGVSVRVWASVGVVLETWKPTILFFEAGVSVRVTVVIARIKIFGKKIEIKASFSFSATIRYDWEIGRLDGRYNDVFVGGFSSDEARLPFGSRNQQSPPISWDPSFTVWPQPKDVTVWFTPDATLDDDGVPQLVLLMMCKGGPEASGAIGNRPFDRVIEAMLTWAIHERFKTEPGFTGPVSGWRLGIAHVDMLERALAQPISLSRSDGQTHTPLNYETLRAFIQKNINLKIREHPNGDPGQSVGGALFPVPSELILRIENDGVPEDRALTDLRTVSEDYQDELDAFFEKMLVLMDERETDSGVGADGERLAIEILFEDYFALLIKTAVEELKQAHLTFGDDHVAVSQLFVQLGKNPETDQTKPKRDAFSKIAAAAGRYQLYGLRVENPEQPGETVGFFDMVELQQPIRADWEGAFAAGIDYKISLLAGANAWFDVNTARSTLDADAVESMRAAHVLPEWTHDTVLPVLRGQNRRYGFADPVRVVSKPDASNPLDGTLWPLTDMLRADLRQRMKDPDQGPLPLALRIGDAENDEADDVDVRKWNWAARIPVHVSRVSRTDGGVFVPSTYAIGGVTEANRYALDRLLVDMDNGWITRPDKIDVFILHDHADSEGTLQHVPLNRSASFVFKTNLSRVSRPHGEIIDGFGSDDELDDLFAATFAGAEKINLLQLVRQGSIVNSGGYFLHVQSPDGSGLPDAIFDSEGGRAQLTLLILFRGENEPARDYFTGAFIPRTEATSALTGAADSTSKRFLYAESTEQVFEPVLEPGHVPLNIVRAEPSRRYRKPQGGRGTLQQALEGRDLGEMTAEDRQLALEEVGEVEVELEERFNLLQWEIKDVDGFVDQSGDSVLPIGPADFEEGDRIPPSYEKTDWLYEQVIPAYKFADENAGLAPADRNVYAGVGKTLRLRLRYRDIYGNRLRGGPSQPVDIDILYFDALQNPLRLPAVACVYGWGNSGSSNISLSATFDPNAFGRETDSGAIVFYDPNVSGDPDNDVLGEQLRETAALYRRTLQQIKDPNVSFRVDTSLSKAGFVALPNSRRTDLARFCRAGLRVITAMLKGDSSGVVAPWKAPIHVAQLPDGQFVEIDVAFRMERPESLVVRDPANESRAYGPAHKRAVTLDAAVTAVAGEDGEQLVKFARRFRNAFSGRVLSTGVGSQGARSFWSIGEAVVDIQVNWTAAADGPAAFAPPPLSTELMSAEFKYDNPMNPGQPEQSHTSVRDADLDDYMRVFIKDLARFLSPEISVTARKAAGAVVDGVLKHKRSMATQVAAKIETVLVDNRAFVDGAKVPAKSTFQDRLTTDLPSAYDVDSVLSYPLKPNSAFEADGGPSVYGKVTLTEQDIKSLPVTFRPVKVQLNRSNPWLVALFDSKREKRSSDETMKPVFRITHVERTFDRQDYRPSAWLTLIEKRDISLAPPDGNDRKPISVPVPLRRFPVPPTLRGQDFESEKMPVGAVSLAAWFESARAWRFQVDYGRPDVDQDTIYLDVRYNNAGDQLTSVASSDNVPPARWTSAVFRELVVYRQHRDEIWAQLNTLPAGQASAQAKVAINAFADLTKRIADALIDETGSDDDDSPGLIDTFQIDEDPLNGGQQREIDVVWLTPEAERRAKRLNITPISNTNQEISCDITSIENGIRGVYTRKPDDPELGEGEWLRRRLGLLELDVLSTENAWSGVELTRNEDLVDNRVTNPKFVYSTAQIRFGEHLTPTVRRFDPVDISEGQARTLSAHVEKMLTLALNQANAQRDNRTVARCDIGWGYDNDWIADIVPEMDPRTLEDRAPIPSQRLVARTVQLVGDASGNTQTIAQVAAAVEIAAKNTVLDKVYPEIETGPDAGKPRGTLVFDLTVYAHIKGEDKPTLQLFNLRLPLARIS